MTRIMYVQGRYSKLQLADGTRIFVQTHPTGIKVSQMFLGLIPTRMLWEFQLPLAIQGPVEASPVAKELLDIVLQSVEHCSTLAEVMDQLGQNTEPLLNNHTQELRRAAKVLRERDIINDFSALLANRKAEGKILLPESLLPHPKEEIRTAFMHAIEESTDEQWTEWLEVGLMYLEHFAPDAEVPADPLENTRAWARRQGSE